MILRTNLNYEKDMFNERIALLRISLNDVPKEEKKIKIINYGESFNQDSNESFRRSLDGLIASLNE